MHICTNLFLEKGKTMNYGIEGLSAPAWDVNSWIDGNGKSMKPVQLSDLGQGFKVIYCFQSWCPGCHSHGFPSLQKMVEELKDYPVRFAVIQTVFEGHEENGFNKLAETQKKYNLKIPFGHDSNEGRQPDIMKKYRTGGTPWFIVIDPDNKVIFNGFHINEDRFIEAIKNMKVKSEIR